jgi:hypothetical protein
VSVGLFCLYTRSLLLSIAHHLDGDVHTCDGDVV